jgi:hypothetical protein
MPRELPSRAVKAPVLKSVSIVPTVTTLSHLSTNSLTSSSSRAPSYMPINAGCFASSTDLSMNIVARGKPEASTTSCRAARSPARAARMPGRMHAVPASAIAATTASAAAARELGSLRAQCDVRRFTTALASRSPKSGSALRKCATERSMMFSRLTFVRLVAMFSINRSFSASLISR